METVFLLIYGLYVSGKNHSFKINMNMTQREGCERASKRANKQASKQATKQLSK